MKLPVGYELTQAEVVVPVHCGDGFRVPSSSLSDHGQNRMLCRRSSQDSAAVISLAARCQSLKGAFLETAEGSIQNGLRVNKPSRRLRDPGCIGGSPAVGSRVLADKPSMMLRRSPRFVLILAVAG